MKELTNLKLYNNKNNGGVSPCINGNRDKLPLDKRFNVLGNCFSGDTKIITRNGVKELKDLVDKEVEVLSRDGVYRKAIGHCYGEQELYELEFKNGKKVLTTLNHRWLVIKKSRSNDKKYIKECFVETKDLKMSNCYRIPFNKIENISIDRDGIINGCIYGDGTLYNENKYSQMALCGEKREYLKEYFINSKHSCIDSNGTIWHYPYPKELKSIPSLDNSLEYLKGFICGLIATDGCVAKSEVRISTSKEEDANKIYEICNILGYQTRIRVESNHKSNFDNKTHILYHIIPYIREEEMFLNPIHKKRIQDTVSIGRSSTSPRSIKYVGVDNVYCVEEPETHTITLEGGILTGQCVGWSVARFNEFAGRDTCKYLMSRNPDVIWTLIEGQGLTRGNEPRLGAAIIWKGPSSSHIANVERVNKDGSIYISESGWNAKSYYWHSTLRGSNFNQGESWLSSYKLLGFVYQPLLKQMYVNAEAGLNLRTEPNTNCTIITTTPYKTKVNIYAIQDGWAASEKGWYSLDYLQNDLPIEKEEPEIPPYYEEKEKNNALLYFLDRLVEFLKGLMK